MAPFPAIPASWANEVPVLEPHEVSALSDGDAVSWSAVLQAPLEQCKVAGASYSPPPNQDQLKEDLGTRQRAFAQRLQALLSGSMPWASTDPVTQKMMRELETGEKEEFKRKGKAEQQEFRRKWGEEKLKDLVERRQFLQEHRKIDISLGTYMSASKVFREEGGTQEDIVPTQKMLRKKLLLGWPHVMFNEESERYDFLYVRKQHSEAFNQCWRAYSEGRKMAGASEGGGQAEEQSSASAEVEKGKKENRGPSQNPSCQRRRRPPRKAGKEGQGPVVRSQRI